jgi:hypothetical protein
VGGVGWEGVVRVVLRTLCGAEQTMDIGDSYAPEVLEMPLMSRDDEPLLELS